MIRECCEMGSNFETSKYRKAFQFVISMRDLKCLKPMLGQRLALAEVGARYPGVSIKFRRAARWLDDGDRAYESYMGVQT